MSALSNNDVAMANDYDTLFDAIADNANAPARVIYLETPPGSSNPTTFRISYPDGKTQEVTFGVGIGDEFGGFGNESKRISKVEGKRATADQASTATWYTKVR